MAHYEGLPRDDDAGGGFPALPYHVIAERDDGLLEVSFGGMLGTLTVRPTKPTQQPGLENLPPGLAKFAANLKFAKPHRGRHDAG